MPYHHVAISLIIIITPKLSLFIGLLWLRIICMSPYFTIRLFYSVCQLVHLLLEGKMRLGRYCEPFFTSQCLIGFPLLQESLIIMLGSLPSIQSNFPPHSKLILGCFLSCHGYLDCCPLISFCQPLSFIPPHCINHSIVGQYLSQLATGCVTCHTSHGCVTHFRPILGNLVEVTLVTSPFMYIVSHTKGTSFP